ncbi:hypothetical protein L3Q82_017641, partial [Scortum barcoo]
ETWLPCPSKGIFAQMWHSVFQTDTGGSTLDLLNALVSKAAQQLTFFRFPSQVGGACKLSTESSQRRCRTPDGKICSGRGKCDCGICICEATDPGKFYGPRCECHDWVCATHNGKTCNGYEFSERLFSAWLSPQPLRPLPEPEKSPPKGTSCQQHIRNRGYCDCGMCECDEGWFGDSCQFQEECNLPKKKSKELCKNTQGVVCSNRGTCNCGSCMCDNNDNRGLVTGRFCECDDSECLDEDTGEVCGGMPGSPCLNRHPGLTYGHGQCYCGNCYCAAGWHGDKCEFQCDISPWESKRRCTSPDGKICSNRGTCVCGECNCYDVDPSGDWGDIHGDTCECDERNCHATYDRYTDDFCSDTSSSSSGGPRGVPRPAERHSFSSVSWVFPRPPPGGTCLEHLPREASRGHPKQMPKPPQLTPLVDAKEQRLYSELLPKVTELLTLSLRERPATLTWEETHFGRLYPAILSFRSLPKVHDHRTSPPTHLERARHPFPVENHGLGFGGADSHPSRFTLAARSRPDMLKDNWPDQAKIHQDNIPNSWQMKSVLWIQRATCPARTVESNMHWEQEESHRPTWSDEDSFFSLTASLTFGVHHRVQGLPPRQSTRDLASTTSNRPASTMEAENMVHSDSMSPASLGICEKLFRRWELKTSLTEGSARAFPTDPHNTFGSARRREATLSFTGVNSNTWRLSWGAISKPTPARRRSPLGNSRVVEGPAPLKELGSRAQAMRGGHGQCNCGRCDCKEGWAGKKCEHPLSCSLSLESSLKKCRGTSNLPCFGRGQCQCGQCICHPPGDSRVYGKNCECDDRQCEDIGGEVCGGHGYCSCGRCICEEGWFGKRCQFPRSCEMNDAQSKELCETSDGIVCSGKGSCHCGQCICSPQDWWVSGEYCECDDRECVTNMTASSAQGMACAIAATVSAWTAGRETLAKSGWEQSTEEERTLVLETGGLAARSDQERHQWSPPGWGNREKHSLEIPWQEREDKAKHGCNSAYH